MSDKSYDKIAQLIGTEMNNAWNNIIRKASSNELMLPEDSINPITEEDIKSFFEELSSAQLDIKFSSSNPKTINRKNYPNPPSTFRRVSGSVTIGVNLEF